MAVFPLRMRSTLTLLLFCAALSGLPAEAPPVEGTMPEDYLPSLRPLLKEAVEKAPSAIMADISLAQAHASTYLQSAPLWPSVSGSIYYQVTNQSETNSTTNTTQGLYYSVSLSQPIFQWGAYKNAAAIGHLGELIAQRNFGEAYRLVAMQIREQYVILVQKKIVLRNDQFVLKIAQDNMTAQKARFDAGASSSADLDSVRLALEQAQLEADRAQEDYLYTKQLLIRLAGVQTLDDNAVVLELPHPTFDANKADAILTGFVGGGVESTFQSQVYNLYAQQGDLNYKIAKVRLLPKLGANAVFSYENYSAPTGNGVHQYGIQTESYNVAATWQIFDGFATTGAKKSALASKRIYERELKTYVDASIDQITNQRHGLGFSYRAMQLAEVHTALMEAQVKRLTQDQTLGYSSQSAIDSSTLLLYQNQFQQALSRSDFYDRWTEFISLAGLDPALENLPARHGH